MPAHLNKPGVSVLDVLHQGSVTSQAKERSMIQQTSAGSNGLLGLKGGGGCIIPESIRGSMICTCHAKSDLVIETTAWTCRTSKADIASVNSKPSRFSKVPKDMSVHEHYHFMKRWPIRVYSPWAPFSRTSVASMKPIPPGIFSSSSTSTRRPDMANSVLSTSKVYARRMTVVDVFETCRS